MTCACRERKSRHRDSRSKERHSSRRRRHKSEETDESEDEFGGYVPRKRQEVPRASKAKPVSEPRETFKKMGCAARMTCTAYVIILGLRQLSISSVSCIRCILEVYS